MCSSSIGLADFLENTADAEASIGNNANADIFRQRAQEARELSQRAFNLETENSELQSRLTNVNRAFKAT